MTHQIYALIRGVLQALWDRSLPDQSSATNGKILMSNGSKAEWTYAPESAGGDADTLDGRHASDFYIKGVDTVGSSDADTLDGKHAADFILASNEANLRVAYATDADKLDGHDSSEFVLKVDLPGYDVESGSLSNADTVDGKHAADFALQDLSNRPANMHLIIDSYNDGNGNWYIEYSNGFVMQGWSGTGTAFHTFLVPYKNANSFQVTFNWYYNSKTAISGSIQNRNSRDGENIPRVQYGRSDGTGVMIQVPSTNYATGYSAVACGWK